MNIESLIFSIFSSLAIVSAILVLRSKNPVHSVLFLILVFCNTSGLFLLLDLDFFAMVFLVVYVGAIAVLFLFVVMMLNIKISEISANVLHYIPVGGLIGIIFLLELFLVIENDFIPVIPVSINSGFGIFEQLTLIISLFFSGLLELSPSTWFSDWGMVQTAMFQCQEIAKQSTSDIAFTQWIHQWDTYSNIEVLGFLLYTYYFPYYLIASLILLVAMIGAIVLTLHKSTTVRRQDVYQQNTREFTKTIQKLQK
jgi:NADH-ubiquinone oxidoreductase chain 6